MTYRLASGVERIRVGDGPALLSRTPLRLVRLNASLAEVLERGENLRAQSPAEARILDDLTEKGLLVRQPGEAIPEDRLPAVSVIIPVKDRSDELRRCLESLARLRYPKEKLEILVVDDGSRDDTPDVARSLGAQVIPSGGQGRGPAAARNRGAAAARGEILAFIDSDCTASAGWLTELVEPFVDLGRSAGEWNVAVVAVGGRVEGMHASSALDRYEAEMSSLCLGRRGRSGQDGNDTFYLPSCNLLVRRKDFLAAGGFLEELQVGEDVDLTWRLRDRGGRIVYTPRGWIWHEHRNRLGAFLRRRFQYGTSEGLLQMLHPQRRKKMVLPPFLTAAAVLAALSFLARSWLPSALGVALVLFDALRSWIRLRGRGVPVSPAWVLWARARAWASLVYYVSYHLVRYYAAPLILAGVAWPRFGLLAALLAVWAGAVDYRVRRPALLYPTFLALYLAEHLAYGAGVFWGCLSRGTFGSYAVLTSAKG